MPTFKDIDRDIAFMRQGDYRTYTQSPLVLQSIYLHLLNKQQQGDVRIDTQRDNSTGKNKIQLLRVTKL